MAATGSHLISHAGFKIKQSPPEPLPFERYPPLLTLSNIVTWTLWFSYNILQLQLASKIFAENSKTIWPLCALLACDFCLNFSEMILGMNLIFTLFCAPESRYRARYELMGDKAPSIDVFITCCGEQVDVILATIAAATAQDYPKSRFKVFVLDDGHDEELRIGVGQASKDMEDSDGPKLIYISRKVENGLKSYFKAGNIQFGIDESNARSGSQYIASLDADMIPEPQWLRKLVPHLILEDGIALVAIPQDYYNVPIDDPLGNKAEFDLWFSLYEPLNDRLDSAMCTGTGYIVRRKALEEIGGWPQVESGEDYMCSTKLSDHGWKIAFIAEKLQVGLAPESLRAHVKQRMRWTDSATAVHKSFGFYLPGSKLTSELNWLQRCVAFMQALRDYSPITTALLLIILPLALFPAEFGGFENLARNANTTPLYRTFAAYYIFQKINISLLHGHVGIRQVWNYQSNEIWCSPYTAYRCLISLLPSSLTSMTFEVSGATQSSTNERSQTARDTILRRLFHPKVLLCLAYCGYASVLLVLRLVVYLLSGETSRSAIFVFPGVILKLLDCVFKIWVPVWYMIYPPVTLERNELLSNRGKKKKDSYRGAWNYGGLWVLDLLSCLVIWSGLR